MKNHCSKKCNFCSYERCSDDHTFYLDGIKKPFRKCDQLGKQRCHEQDKLGRLVREFCRGLCSFCSLPEKHLTLKSESPTKPYNKPCTNNKSYNINDMKCHELNTNQCNQVNKNGKLMKNHCSKKCNFCSYERCSDDHTFYLDGIKKPFRKCDQLGKQRCHQQDKMGRLVREFCRDLCNICSLPNI